MWMICDANDVVQDIASQEANLSRGYTFPSYKKYEIQNVDFKRMDLRVGDSYDGIKATPNTQGRKEKRLKQVKVAMVGLKPQLDAAGNLAFPDVEADIKAVWDELEAEKNDLESVI